MRAWRLMLALGFLSLMAGGAVAEEKRPNILFLFADDWGRQASAYAEIDDDPGINAVVRTPNFDALAKQGVLFRNAFVSAPSCTPCRSALLSGQHFWRTGRGAILRGAVWDFDIPAYPLLLQNDGYHIGRSYKVWGPGTPSNAPYGGNKNSYQKAGGRINQFSQQTTKMVKQGKSLEDAKQELYNESRDNFAQFLADREKDQPFCFWYGPTNVHRKWTKGSGKELWNVDPDDLKGKMPSYLPDVHEVRQDLADYLGEIEAFDASLGPLIEELKKSGEYENTLIVISGDHGPPGFPHGKCNLYDFGAAVPLAIVGPGVKGGRVVDDLVSLTDLMPTFLEMAGHEIPEVVTGRSLWPILKSDKQGQVDPERKYVLTGRERHVEIARAGYLPYPQRAIRTQDHLLIINFRPDRYPLGDHYRLDGDNPPTEEELTEVTRTTIPDEDAGPTKAWLVQNRDNPKWKEHFEWVYGRRPRLQLFDLKKDPHQANNVADDPEYAEVVAELEETLLTQLKQTGDPRMENDGKYFETPPLAGPLKGK